MITYIGRPLTHTTDRYKFKDEETLRLVLRTHTTAVSTWALHRLAEDPRPARYFSIDRVFRNETVDATHLAEFHQIEGVIADFGLTLGGMSILIPVQQPLLADSSKVSSASSAISSPTWVLRTCVSSLPTTLTQRYASHSQLEPRTTNHINSQVWRSSDTTRA